MSATLLDIRGVTKRFPGNTALDRVSLRVGRGEIVALLGHNGSGKSTLVKVLSGLYLHDEGEVVVGSPSAPAALHFIHQNLGLIPTLSVVENLDLGIRPRAGGVLPFRSRRERDRVARLIAEFGGDFDVDAPVARLTPAQRTIVAIARAFDGWADGDHVLVLDEPTAALHGEEVDVLLAAVRAVAARGAGVIYVSHRLGEVVELADRVVVLRNGLVVAERTRGGFDRRALVELIAGAHVSDELERVAVQPGAVRLRLSGVTAPGLHGVDLEVRAGEVVGVSGLVGSGMEQLGGVVFGAITRESGEVVIDGVPLPAGDPAAAIRAGLGFVPADRRERGSIPTFSARENLTLPRLSDLRGRSGAVDGRRERAAAAKWMDRVNVLPAGFAEQRFDLFSGGNQQKIVLAKWLRLAPAVLLLDEPTQGVDAGAQSEIYDLLVAFARAGAAVVVASSDSKELATVADRVVVLREGHVSAQFEGDAVTESILVRAVVDDAHPATSPAAAESRTA